MIFKLVGHDVLTGWFISNVASSSSSGITAAWSESHVWIFTYITLCSGWKMHEYKPWKESSSEAYYLLKYSTVTHTLEPIPDSAGWVTSRSKPRKKWQWWDTRLYHCCVLQLQEHAPGNKQMFDMDNCILKWQIFFYLWTLICSHIQPVITQQSRRWAG